VAQKKLGSRVREVAEDLLQSEGLVSAVDLCVGLGWVASPTVDNWRQGRIASFEDTLPVDGAKLAGRRGREQHRSGTARALPPAVDHQRERPRRIAVRVNDRRVSGRRRAAALLEERQRVSGERDRQRGAQ
jgi:hypothetical protein